MSSSLPDGGRKLFAQGWWPNVAHQLASPFGIPFSLSAERGQITIAPDFDPDRGTALRIRGADWAGFQSQRCVNELWDHTVEQYIQFLFDNEFNAVRLPLSAVLVNANTVERAQCGEYNRRHAAFGERAHWGSGEYNTLEILDDVL